MKAVVQRVTQASVEIGGRIHSAIGRGMVVLLGVEQADTSADADFLAKKIAELRMFEDADGKMNVSAADAGGSALVVSQFTLCADCRKGRRPSFISAAPPNVATELYEHFVAKLAEFDVPVKTGIFQAKMLVHIDNDGPVTFVVDTSHLRKD
ncbi:MAG TPA: D-aminoacyl-tRNA deacylase [Planctomycetota bacterium]|nr:D-aminoacyl-tRNA deacylase [Planctomycetota bacterium]